MTENCSVIYNGHLVVLGGKMLDGMIGAGRLW